MGNCCRSERVEKNCDVRGQGFSAPLRRNRERAEKLKKLLLEEEKEQSNNLGQEYQQSPPAPKGKPRLSLGQAAMRNTEKLLLSKNNRESGIESTIDFYQSGKFTFEPPKLEE